MFIDKTVSKKLTIVFNYNIKYFMHNTEYSKINTYN